MGKFWDMCSEETKKEAEEFLERIKSGEIRRIRIYKDVGKKEFDERRALESFDSLTKSEEYQKTIKDYYK